MAGFSRNDRHFRFGSIRFKVFVLYCLILSATFSVFSASIYLYFRHEIYQKLDTILEVRANGLASAVKTHLATRRVDAPSGWAAFFSGNKDNGGKSFSAIAGFLTEAELPSSRQQLRIAAQIFDLDGRVIAESGVFHGSEILDRTIIAEALEGKRRVRNVQWVSRGSKPVPARALVQVVMDADRPRYVVRVLMPLKPVESELSRLRRFLIFLVIATLLITGWAGIFLVRVTLRPVDRIVRKIRGIRSDNLGERLYLHNTGDEINRLARTFNEMLERLEKAFDSQKQIVQDLSHELKTPLTILRGQLEVALTRPRSPEEYAALLQGSVSEIENIRRIIDDLLMLARLDSRGGTLEMKRVDLAPLMQGLMEDVKVLAQSKTIELEFDDSDCGDCAIQGNQIHLKRLFMNLLDNAVKYSSEGGNIRVELKAMPDRVLVRVADSGPGIAPEHAPRIFDRFYRGEKGQRSDSYGLGLSIVKSIVDTHQGQIAVDGRPGRGAIFSVSLPKKQNMRLLPEASSG